MQLDRQIADFAAALGSGAVEVYNEFSLQHELGLFLRNQLSGCKVQFERNVSYFNLSKATLEKREIDIVVTLADSGERLSAIELKYPKNGQVPESIFSFAKTSPSLSSSYLLAFNPHTSWL